MSKVHIISPDQQYDHTPRLVSKYQLVSFQIQSDYHLSQGQDIMVTAHTGSGKTTPVLSAIAIARALGKRVFYTSPIKALSNQKFHEFSQIDGIDLGLLTGDLKFNPHARDCVIMTTEILEDMLFKEEYQEDLANVMFIIFDEIHYISDEDRGSCWENCIINLPKHVVFAGLSGSLPDAEKLCQWISLVRQRPINLISTLKRPVPLTHFAYCGQELINIMDAKNNFNDANYSAFLQEYKTLSHKSNFNPQNLLNPMVAYLQKHKLCPAIMFTFSCRRCFQLAHKINATLTTPEEQAKIQHLIDGYLSQSATPRDTLDHLPKLIELRALLLRGIGVHHSRLETILKEIVELLAEQGLCKLLICTETFAMGFNAPMKVAIFCELEKWDGKGQTRLLNPSEYLQMAGRAGRRGLDLFGSVIYLPLQSPISVGDARSMLTGHTAPLESKFTINYKLILQLIASGRESTSIHKSYLSHQNSQLLTQLKCEFNGLQQEITRLQALRETLVNNSDQYVIITQLNQFEAELIPNQSQSGFGFVIKPDKNKHKKIQNQIHQLTTQLRDFYGQDKLNQILNIFKNITQTQAQCQTLELQINNYTKGLTDAYQQGIDELLDMGYLQISNQTPISYELTEKGVMASKLRSSNEILMTELLHQPWLEDLTIPELCAVLSVFADSTSQAEDEELPKINQLTIATQEAINWLLEKSEEFCYYPTYIQLIQKQGLGLGLAELAYKWGQGITYLDLCNTQDPEQYRGNFILDMRRLSKILDEVINVVNIIQKPVLEKNLRLVKEVIVRDMIAFDSLYLKVK